MANRTAIRKAAGWSRARAAVMAGVSEHLAQIYEIDPDQVREPEKRARLDATWRTMAEIARSGDGSAPPPRAA